MHRKLKRVIEIADFWLNFRLGCEFSENTPAYMEVFRETDFYTVLLSKPSAAGVMIKIVPKNRTLSEFSEQDRENIAYNERNLFRVTMMFQEMEEKKIRLDKKGRRELQDYLARREAEGQGRL